MNNNKNFTQIEIPIVKKLYELYTYTHKAVSVFPKHEKYSIGEKLERYILETMELIVIGNNQPKNFKDAYILKANGKLEILKLLYRLAFDCGFLKQNQYLQAEENLQESGRMIGGWIKYLRNN